MYVLKSSIFIFILYFVAVSCSYGHQPAGQIRVMLTNQTFIPYLMKYI